MAPLAFADWSQLIVDALDAKLAPPVSTSIPRERPPLYVRVLRTGGTRTRVTDRPQITVETFGRIESKAERLALDVRAALAGMVGSSVGGVHVYKVEELAGPANLPDPITGDSRYTQTVIVHGRLGEVAP